MANWIERALRNTFSPETLSKGKDFVEDIGDFGGDILAKTGIRPDEYHLEMYGRKGYGHSGGTPDFRWFNPRTEEWTEGDIHGSKLPKRSKKIISEAAKKYQYEQLEAGNTNPWGM